MKSMKKGGMKRKAKRVSKVAKGRGAKARVFRGSKARTSGGLKKSDLTKNREGKIVSKKRSDLAKKRYVKSGHGGTQSPWHQRFSGCWWQVCQRPGAIEESK